MPKALDQEWFEKYKEIYSYKRSYFVNKNPQIELDRSSNSIIIVNHPSKRTPKEKAKLISYLNKRQKKINDLRLQITNSEKNDFIKKKYLKKLEIVEIENLVHYLELNEENSLAKQVEINNLLAKKYDFDESDLRQFACEFIDFVKFIQTNEIDDAISEIVDPAFYKVEYKKSDVDFSKYLEAHKNRMQIIKPLEEIKFNASQIKKIFRKFIKKTSLSGITIRIEDRLLFSVEPISRRINIPKDIEITGKRLVEIIAHEVCVHLYRSIQGYENTGRNGVTLKVLGTSDTENLQIEEGLATYFEQNIFGMSDEHDIFRLFQHYFSAISVLLARNYEPIEVYKKLVKIHHLISPIINNTQDHNDSATLKRIKRLYYHFENPSIGLANPKIAIYLLGNREIWKYKKNSGNIINLFAGKCGIGDLNNLKNDLEFKIPEEYMGQKDIDFDYLRQEIIKCF